jgi:hypothetical protein
MDTRNKPLSCSTRQYIWRRKSALSHTSMCWDNPSLPYLPFLQKGWTSTPSQVAQNKSCHFILCRRHDSKTLASVLSTRTRLHTFDCITTAQVHSTPPFHLPCSHSKERFIRDLKEAVLYVEANPNMVSKGATMYGIIAKAPAPEFVEDFLIQLMDRVYST